MKRNSVCKRRSFRTQQVNQDTFLWTALLAQYALVAHVWRRYTEICSSYRLTAGSFSLQLHLCRFALHTGSHQAVFHCSDTKEICSAYRPTAGTISLPLHL
ncbi:hypothetical protein WJX77_010298 [Trebouxia sp. C0004]